MHISQVGGFLLFIAGFVMFIAISYNGFPWRKTVIFLCWLLLTLAAIAGNTAIATIPLTAGAMGAITALVIRENIRKRRGD